MVRMIKTSHPVNGRPLVATCGMSQIKSVFKTAASSRNPCVPRPPLAARPRPPRPPPGDAYPEAVQLPKGDYTVRLALRHESLELLEKMRGTCVVVVRGCGVCWSFGVVCGCVGVCVCVCCWRA